MRFAMKTVVAATALSLPMMASAQKPEIAFSYKWPAAATAIAPLNRWLTADRQAKRTKVLREAAEAKREAAREKYPFRSYTYELEWQVVTDTPRLLSLSSAGYTFTGGAHGSPWTGSLVWDKAGRQRLAPTALFTSPAALEKAIAGPYCKALNAERTKRRGEPVTPGDDPFSACPKLKELVVLLGSSNRQKIDRIGLIADPYVAGAYAEGAYEITLPVTPAVLAVVKPAWRGAFAVR